MKVESEQVMNYRGGSVLGKKTVLKSDHFPGCQNKRLLPQIDGAPNYRQAGTLPVHGVAIPTIDGIRNVLNHIGAHINGPQKRVLWHNLREEPVVYINGRPFVLRDVERPFSNLEYTGINRARVEQMESRLKEDILLEAARYESKILVTDELPDGQMIDQWESVIDSSIRTPLEVYEEMQNEGYLVDYERVPITDEKSPKERDFDNLASFFLFVSCGSSYHYPVIFLHGLFLIMQVHRISKVDINTEIVFNCQMGRGRTTTGMVIATLVYLHRTGKFGTPGINLTGKVLGAGMDVNNNMPNSEEALRRGEYGVIRSLLRVLEGGVAGKWQVDKVIDQCDSMQNLREAIASYRGSILRQPDEMKKQTSLSFFIEYLERYYFLICFAVYLHTERAILCSNSLNRISFSDWMKARPELYSILRRLLRRDPMGALGFSKSKPSSPRKSESIDGLPRDMSIVAATRNGEVLGSQTVLKSDHCPGCQNLNLPERIDGAPNFREVPGFPVYGVANPTVDGIRAVIERISSTKGGRPVLWHNMREEPVIYINGKPFVLREAERPYKNMLEYTGIDVGRVERMEARLKEDILREASHYNGAIMVIHEADSGQIHDVWEHINDDAVQTPLEVYKLLENEGLPIKYARVPITDGKAPKSSDFDTIAANIVSSPRDAAYVFNCQMGIGRTTTGTVIACLLKYRIDRGRTVKMQIEDDYKEMIEKFSSSGEEVIEEGNGSESDLNSEKETDTHKAFGINDILLLRKITRLFDNGIDCREVLDSVIDRCSALQNIRQAVLRYRKVFNQQNLEQRVRRVALYRGAEYLERYFRLIAFSAYLGSEAFDDFCQQGKDTTTFKTWIHKRSEIQTMKWSIRLRPGKYFAIREESKVPYESVLEDVVMEAIVKARSGSVLGKGSILKMYFFPGQKKSNVPFEGAPHMYKVDAYPVYSMATPTINGAKEILTYLGAKATNDKSVTEKVVITDLREEVVVYIRGTPYVLRELDQPFDTLKHVGVSGSIVERMESRLKEDIYAEVTQSGGQILLHREEINPSSRKPSVIGYWENISPGDVKTPAEVYEALKEDSFNIDYKRIPFTREREALAADIDAIQYRKDERASSYIFISHTGSGGVSYAIAITCLGLDANAKFTINEKNERYRAAKREDNVLSSGEEAFKLGDYRDILSLTRVLINGPKSKEEVDIVIERCAGAGHIRDDILHYWKKMDSNKDDDETCSVFKDMGIKALRRYFFLITFRSYLHCTSPNEMGFKSWMEGRPELGHLCANLKIG